MFTPQQELGLKKYLECAFDIHFGLTTQEIRKLAFEYAHYHKLKIPVTWTSNKSAGVEWQKAFLSRHPDISIWKPQVIFFSKLVHLITEFNMPLCQVNTSLLNNHNFQEFFLPSSSFLREEPVAGPNSGFSYGTNHVPSIGVKNNRSKTKTCLIETKNYPVSYAATKQIQFVEQLKENVENHDVHDKSGQADKSQNTANVATEDES